MIKQKQCNWLFKTGYLIYSFSYCKDQIWVFSPKGRWTSAQRAQNNDFLEKWLKNWALMNQTNVKVDPDDNIMKLNRFVLKKIVLGTVRGNQFLYISFRFNYKVSSWLLQYFSLDFRSPYSPCSPFFYTLFPFHPYPPCASQVIWSWYLSHQPLPKVFR